MNVAEYAAAIAKVNEAMPPEAKERLRAVRLWAWRQVGTHRKCADDATKAGLSSIAALHNRMANEALMHVCTLNDFFPEPFDTADKDDKRNE